MMLDAGFGFGYAGIGGEVEGGYILEAGVCWPGMWGLVVGVGVV